MSAIRHRSSSIQIAASSNVSFSIARQISRAA
jgi:hypothetical protein